MNDNSIVLPAGYYLVGDFASVTDHYTYTSVTTSISINDHKFLVYEGLGIPIALCKLKSGIYWTSIETNIYLSEGWLCVVPQEFVQHTSDFANNSVVIVSDPSQLVVVSNGDKILVGNDLIIYNNSRLDYKGLNVDNDDGINTNDVNDISNEESDTVTQVTEEQSNEEEPDIANATIQIIKEQSNEEIVEKQQEYNQTYFGGTIRAVRKQLGFTARELAHKCCVSKSTIKRTEQGIRRPDNVLLARLSEALGLDFLSLFELRDTDCSFVMLDLTNAPKHMIDLALAVKSLWILNIDGSNKDSEQAIMSITQHINNIILEMDKGQHEIQEG